MSGPIVPPLTISDVADGGAVTGRPITTLEVTNGTLSVSGRTATLTTGGGGGGGGVTSIATTGPISGGTITTTGTISIDQSDTTTDGYLSSTDWNTFNNKGSGDGDVVGPGSSTDGNVVLFDGTTGKLIKDGTKGIPTGVIVGTSDTQTLTNKTIDCASNTVSNYEGTAVISTGETGATKFLREDGAGGASWEAASGSGTVTSVAGTGTSGITITGGPITTSGTLTVDLDDTAVTPGTYGDATNVAQLTIDQQGRITAAADVAISAGGTGTVTSITAAADTGSGTAITTSGTFTFTGGTRIRTTVSGTTVTIDNDAIEGTAVLSTGETGGTKFLREDGDGTSSWQAATATIPDPLQLSYGSGAAPTYSFSSDTDTGMYAISGNLYFSINSTTRVRLGNDGSTTKLQVGDGGDPGNVTTNGGGHLILDTNLGTNSGTITIQAGAAQDILIEPDTTGKISFYTGANAWTIENGQGVADQVLTTDGAGAATWEDAGGGGGSGIGMVYCNRPTTSYTGQTQWPGIGGPFGSCDSTTISWTLDNPVWVPFIARRTGSFVDAALDITTGEGTTALVDVGVYSDSNGNPNTLLGEGTVDVETTGEKTGTLTESSVDSLECVAGTQYWLSFVRQSGVGTFSVRGTNIRYLAQWTWTNSTTNYGFITQGSGSANALPATAAWNSGFGWNMPMIGISYTY